jgi:hypothetical protein
MKNIHFSTFSVMTWRSPLYVALSFLQNRMEILAKVQGVKKKYFPNVIILISV